MLHAERHGRDDGQIGLTEPSRTREINPDAAAAFLRRGLLGSEEGDDPVPPPESGRGQRERKESVVVQWKPVSPVFDSGAFPSKKLQAKHQFQPPPALAHNGDVSWPLGRPSWKSCETPEEIRPVSE